MSRETHARLPPIRWVQPRFAAYAPPEGDAPALPEERAEQEAADLTGQASCEPRRPQAVRFRATEGP